MENTKENLEKLYKYHKNLYKVYDKSVTRPNAAKFHLDRAQDIVKKMKKIYKKREKKANEELNEDKIIKRTIFCWRGLGDWYRKMGNLELFKNYLQKSLTAICLRSKSQDKDYYDVKNNRIQNAEGDVLNSLGVLCQNMGNLPKAEEFFLKALKIRLNLFGENHYDVGDSLNNLGLLYQNMGNLNLHKAEDFFMRSLRIRYNLFGENHSDVASSLDNLGTLYKYMGDQMKAEDFFLENSPKSL